MRKFGMSPEVIDLWRGLVRVAPAPGFGDGASSQKPNGCAADDHKASAAKNFKRPAPWRRARFVCRSIFVRQHHGDGGLRVVNVKRATLGDELYKAGGPVVGVFDVQGHRQAV